MIEISGVIALLIASGIFFAGFGILLCGIAACRYAFSIFVSEGELEVFERPPGTNVT